MDASETVTLDRGGYTTCTVNLFGGNITSWRIKNAEQLFVSTSAMYNTKAAIRGGVQIAFPRYGPWKDGPHHGFARLVKWRMEQPPKTLEFGDIEAILILEDDAYTRSLWNYKFCLSYRIRLLEKEIKLSINLTNTDINFFMYSQIVFHPYFRCRDVRDVKIVGLLECDFHNKLTSETTFGDAPVLKIFHHIDRIYMNTKKNSHILANLANNMIKLDKFNCPDTVIWNPWIKWTKKFKDLLPYDYLKMLVVAVGYAMNTVRVAPGETFNCKTSFKVLKE